MAAATPLTFEDYESTLASMTKNRGKIREASIFNESGAATDEIRVAWEKYQTTEKYGVEFGRICCGWRRYFKSRGGHGSKGKGLVHVLYELKVPKMTAYYWMNRYEESNGQRPKKIKTAKLPAEIRTLFKGLKGVDVRNAGRDRFTLTLKKLTAAQLRAVRRVLGT